MAKIGSITVFTEQGAIEAYKRFYKKSLTAASVAAEVVRQRAEADLLQAYPQVVNHLSDIQLEVEQSL